MLKNKLALFLVCLSFVALTTTGCTPTQKTEKPAPEAQSVPTVVEEETVTTEEVVQPEEEVQEVEQTEEQSEENTK